MKKLFAILLSGMMVFSLSACTNNSEKKDTVRTDTTTQTKESLDDAFCKDLKKALEERWKIEEKDAELTTEIYTRYVDTELKYLKKYEHKEDFFENHEIGDADKDYTRWHKEYEDEVFEDSTEALYKLNNIKKITFENEEYQKMFDRLVKYGEEYSRRDD